MKPVVAAPLPSAAARVSTSSREVIAREGTVLAEEVEVVAVDTVAVDVAGAERGAGADGADGAVGIATDGATVGCLIAELCLLKSSSIACWSDFFKPCETLEQLDAPAKRVRWL